MIGELESKPLFLWKIKFSSLDNELFYESPPFTFADRAWYFGMKKMICRNMVHLFVTLECKTLCPPCHIIGSLSIEKSDSSLHDTQNFDGFFTLVSSHFAVMQHNLEDLLPSDILTLICHIKSNLNGKESSANENAPVEMDDLILLSGLDTLSENFKDLSANKETCDVTLIVQGKEYGAHKSVLIARSSVFAANFKHDTLESRTGIITILDCDPDSFQQFLDYLYCGKLEQLSVNIALHLYYTSDKYNVQELKAFCVENLTKCLAVENMCEIVVFAAEYDDIQLLYGIQDFFNKNVRTVLESPEWECLMKKDYRLASKLLKDMAKVKFEN